MNWNDLATDPMTNIGLSLLAASGWQPQPVSFAGGLGRGALGGLSQFLNAKRSAAATAATEAQTGEAQARTKLLGEQFNELQRARAAREQALQYLMPQGGGLPDINDRYRAAATMAPYQPSLYRELLGMGMPWEIKKTPYGAGGEGVYAVNPLGGPPQPLFGGQPRMWSPMDILMARSMGIQLPGVQMNLPPEQKPPAAQAAEVAQALTQPDETTPPSGPRRRASRTNAQLLALRRQLQQKQEQEYKARMAKILDRLAGEPISKSKFKSFFDFMLYVDKIAERAKQGKIPEAAARQFWDLLPQVMEALPEHKQVLYRNVAAVLKNNMAE